MANSPALTDCKPWVEPEHGQIIIDVLLHFVNHCEIGKGHLNQNVLISFLITNHFRSFDLDFM